MSLISEIKDFRTKNVCLAMLLKPVYHQASL